MGGSTVAIGRALRLSIGSGSSLSYRLAGDLGAPVVEHIPQRLLDRVARGPAGGDAELAGVGDEQRLVDGADPRGVDVDLDGAIGEVRERVQGVGDLDALARAEVVDLAGIAFLGEQAVAADDVADVGEVADDLE